MLCLSTVEREEAARQAACSDSRAPQSLAVAARAWRREDARLVAMAKRLRASAPSVNAHFDSSKRESAYRTRHPHACTCRMVDPCIHLSAPCRAGAGGRLTLDRRCCPARTLPADNILSAQWITSGGRAQANLAETLWSLSADSSGVGERKNTYAVSAGTVRSAMFACITATLARIVTGRGWLHLRTVSSCRQVHAESANSLLARAKNGSFISELSLSELYGDSRCRGLRVRGSPALTFLRFLGGLCSAGRSIAVAWLT